MGGRRQVMSRCPPIGMGILATYLGSGKLPRIWRLAADTNGACIARTEARRPPRFVNGLAMSCGAGSG